ncbi:MAG: hypothetical protein K0R75_3578 [Paenibacillaceae bacterium]|nr:hypothetical protein [Paenibacillaceae bacterium]
MSTKAFIAIIAIVLCSFIEYLDHAVVAVVIPSFVDSIGGAYILSWILPIYVTVSKVIQLIVVLIGLHIVLNYTRRSSN